ELRSANDRRQRRIALGRLGFARRELCEGVADTNRRCRAVREPKLLRPRRVEAALIIDVVETGIADAEQYVADEQQRVDARHGNDDLSENRHAKNPSLIGLSMHSADEGEV